MTPLCKIAYKYKTDKYPQLGHSYTPFYYALLKNKKYLFKKILEFGVGYPEAMDHCPNYITGASLYMWRDFFPKAQIYGVDIDPRAIFQAKRIKTFLYDTMKKKNLKKLIKQK